MSDGGFSVGKLLVLSGLVLAAVGVVLLVGEKLGIHFGRLPGDIHVESDKSSFHLPIVTSIVLSIIATVLLNWFFRK